MSFYIIPTVNIRKENISFALIYQYPGCFMALGKICIIFLDNFYTSMLILNVLTRFAANIWLKLTKQCRK